MGGRESQQDRHGKDVNILDEVETIQGKSAVVSDIDSDGYAELYEVLDNGDLRRLPSKYYVPHLTLKSTFF